MFFWIICALLTFVAALAVLFPFLRNSEAGIPAYASDLAIYKDQLREIDDDEKRSLISPHDATSARTEVSRRILKLDVFDAAPKAMKSSRIVVMAAALFLPVMAWGFYGYTGSPLLPDQPILARLSVAPNLASVEVLIAQAERHLAVHPDDVRGWMAVAPIYLKTERYEDALNAFQKLIQLSGPKAEFEIGVGQALAGANQGKIGPDSNAAFERAAKLDPDNAEPKIYLATGLAQQGKYPQAKAAFEKLLAQAPADARWRPLVVDSLAELAKAMSTTAQGGLKGPTQQDVDNAAQMAAPDRMAMIEGMVAKLDADLTANPDNAEGWQRLIKSYTVLGKPELASQALARANTAMKDNQASLDELQQVANELGLKLQ